MYLYILLGVLTFIGVIIAVIGFASKHDGLAECGSCITLILIVALIACSACTISCKIRDNVGERELVMRQERSILVYRLDHLYGNVVEESELYNSVIAFNTKIIKQRVKLNNKWLNLFVEEKVAAIELIELNNGE